MINDGTDTVSGTFEGLDEGDVIFTGTSLGLQVSYVLRTINDIGLRGVALDAAVPGPWPGGPSS